MVAHNLLKSSSEQYSRLKRSIRKQAKESDAEEFI
jgi:hypothetical protein